MLDITNALVCDITGWSIQNGFVDYEIHCDYALNNYKWTIRRRYNQFYALNNELMPFGLDLNLPPKKTFGNKKQAFIEERKAGLQAFLDKLTVHPLIYCSEPVIAFLKIPDLPTLTELHQYSMIALRNARNIILTRNIPKASWRYCKLYSHVMVGTITGVYSWMNYGSDQNGYSPHIPEILTFLQKQQCPYICKHSHLFSDQYGIGVIRNLWTNGSLRDQLYRRPVIGTFWQKYGMDNECFVLNINNVKFITRQVLEALMLLQCLSIPFVDIHCGNIMVTETESQLADVEFALCGQTSFNRPAMIRAKHVVTIEDMMVFNFGQLIYEMAAGTLVFPDHCTEEAIMKLLPQYHDLMNIIFNPRDKMPSLLELSSHSFYSGINIIPLNSRNITIPGAMKAYLDNLCSNITKRFQNEKSLYNERQRNDHFEQILHSDSERQRRKDLVLAQLKMKTGEN